MLIMLLWICWWFLIQHEIGPCFVDRYYPDMSNILICDVFFTDTPSPQTIWCQFVTNTQSQTGSSCFLSATCQEPALKAGKLVPEQHQQHFSGPEPRSADIILIFHHGSLKASLLISGFQWPESNAGELLLFHSRCWESGSLTRTRDDVMTWPSGDFSAAPNTNKVGKSPYTSMHCYIWIIWREKCSLFLATAGGNNCCKPCTHSQLHDWQTKNNILYVPYSTDTPRVFWEPIDPYFYRIITLYNIMYIS